MGKKIKSLDHILPDDVFGKVLLESQQVATVTLMLDSPEDDIVIKAGGALFQFSEKCDENKLVLLESNALDKLLRLIQNDGCKIRRIASMVIGSISQHSDVRKALRKREETIPLLTRLLLWEDDTVVQEYVTLCLASMAIDYSSKSNLCSYGTMEPLIHCLQSLDPDVQKNSIQTIALMLQDYPSRHCLLSANGLPPVVTLLKSEYPVIQYYALQSLQLAAEDDEVRCALSQMKIARILVDFLSRPEMSELSVFAVMALNNCLADDTTMQVFRDSGGLQRLMTLISEVQVTPEEEKKSKKERATSKAVTGKKSRLDDDVDEKQRMRGGGGGGGWDWGADPLLAVIPDIKEQVARTFALVAVNSECRRLLHEQDAEKRLIALLGSDRSPGIQASAALALGTLATDPVIRDTIYKCDGLDALVKLIAKTDSADLLDSISLAFANLTTDSPLTASEPLKKVIVDHLLSMLTKPRETTVVCATIALSNMAADEMLRSEVIAGRKVVAALADLLHSKSSLIQAKALMALSSYVLDSEAQKQLMETTNCVHSLLNVVESGDELVTQSASWLIYIIATSNAAAATDINRKGGLPILRRIQQSTTRRNSFSELALRKLFDAELTAKYAFTGSLGPDDIIPDGFFDTGRLRDSDSLKAIEEYGAEPVNQRRPVIFVNAKPQGPAIETRPLIEVTDAPTEKTTKTSAGVSSGGAAGGHPSSATTTKAGREGKGKRSQKEKEEKQREEEMLHQQHLLLLQQQLKDGEKAEAAKEREPYVIPGDNRLIQYIAEAQELITVLPDTREQIKALARFVSDKMGGAMDHEGLVKSDAEVTSFVTQMKAELKSNVIPIGKIRTGIHYHRALLFKVLADRVGLACSLTRGNYGRAWNTVTLIADDENLQLGCLSHQLKPFIVDVISQPGRLISVDSCDSVAYQSLLHPSFLPITQSPLRI